MMKPPSLAVLPGSTSFQNNNRELQSQRGIIMEPLLLQHVQQVPWNSTTSSSSIILEQRQQQPSEHHDRPPLNSIVQGWNVTGDPSWLLDLAIIGFPKTGTSTMMNYLHMSSPRIHVFDEERCELGYNQQVILMRDLYRSMPPGNDIIRGIKCPRDLETRLAIRNYQRFFPKTDFMIGVRHPVEWLESFYNFRVHNFFSMPPAETLIGQCTKRRQGVCTFRGNFHLFLANLGKTNIESDPKQQLLIPPQFRTKIDPIPVKGRIFLWDMSQLKPDDDLDHIDYYGQRYSNAQFREDLRQFLGLQEDLPEMIKVKPGFNHTNTTVLEHVSSQKIDICERQYNELRQVLISQGTLAAQWIREYFLESQDVYVSQRDYFSNVILKRWERDPCLDRNRVIAGS